MIAKRKLTQTDDVIVRYWYIMDIPLKSHIVYT